MKADCWSLGIILYELLGNSNPFHADDPHQFLENIVHKPLNLREIQRWLGVSPEAQDLVI